MRIKGVLLMATTVFTLTNLVPVCQAGIPGGEVSMWVKDPMDLLWDVSSNKRLQFSNYDIVDSDGDETDIDFSSPFIQDGAGKLSGAGQTTVTVDGPGLDLHFGGTYKVTGAITSSRGIARLTFTSSAKGTTVVEGRRTTVTTSLMLKAVVDSVNRVVSMTEVATGAASGIGSAQEKAPVHTDWWEITEAMGDGTWWLVMNLQNDGAKKVFGTAEVRLSSDAVLDFQVKGAYQASKDTSLLVLTPGPRAKGSTLRVAMRGNEIQSIKGKVSGQIIDFVED
jgi:hypothetical protein